MDCKECESILAAYAVGDVDTELASACGAHVESCSACRTELRFFTTLIDSIADEPALTVSPSESVALSAALARVQLQPQTVCRPVGRQVPGLPGLMAASVFAFFCLATALALQAFGIINVWSVIASTSRVPIALTWLVVVVVTSFIPIAVTAQRRPLNGLTFRR